ncbi:hypothetical protein AB0H73_09650 [Streptomyces olivoreticuli]
MTTVRDNQAAATAAAAGCSLAAGYAALWTVLEARLLNSNEALAYRGL